MTVVVGLLAEDAALLEGLAEGTGGGVEVDGDPEALAADFFHKGTLNLLKPVERIGTERSGAGPQGLRRR